MQTVLNKIVLPAGVVYLEDFEEGKGKIIVESFDNTYSKYWGSMGKGSNISSFIARTSDSYFVGKLLGAKSEYRFCSKKTFRNLRQEIKERLNWYEHTEFQKDMRDQINDFQQSVDSSDAFVAMFSGFIEGLDYYLIDDRHQRSYVKEQLNIEECWYMIGETVTNEYKHLCKLHKQLCNHLKSQAGE